jgi:predicted dehydrogenase
MVAFCDIVEERARKAAQEYGTAAAKVFADYRELIRLDLDVVHVLTPNKTHAPITVARWRRASSHVRKAYGHQYGEARKMLEAARRTGKKLTTATRTASVPTACT